MAKNENKQWTDKDKKDYYAKRVKDTSLSEGQRNFAAKRLESLTATKQNASKGNQKRSQNYGGNKAQSFRVTVTPYNNNHN